MKSLRTILILVVFTILLTVVVLPPLLGMFTRHLLLAGLSDPESGLHQESGLTIASVHPAWFHSEIRLTANGMLFSADPADTEPVSASIYILHGPWMLNLADNPAALADIQLINTSSRIDPRRHFSASALWTLTPSLRAELNGIAGVSQPDSDLWLHLRISTPLSALFSNLFNTLFKKTQAGTDPSAFERLRASSQIELWQER